MSMVTASKCAVVCGLIHGFRGGDTTFKDFPSRLKTIAIHDHIEVKVYPKYKTAGDFQLAVSNLLAWLQEQAELQHKAGYDHVQFVLLGHSMGGIVAAEAILQWKQQPSILDGDIIGLLAYDTPFYSVNHRFVTSQALNHAGQINREVNRFWSATSSVTTAAATAATRSTTGTRAAAIEYPGAAKKTSSSKWGLLAGVVGVAAAGAAAYMAREKITASVTDAFDHLEFVSTLMDLNGCWERVRRLTELPDVLFKCFYVQLSGDDSLASDPRTFIALPPPETSHYFIPIPSRMEGEIDAHTSIFDPAKNDHYYNLGLDSITLISEMVARHHRQHDNKKTIPSSPPLIPASSPYSPSAMTISDDPHSTSKRMRMTLACERCRLKKVCGRCCGAKATCSYTGAPTQIDLFNLVQLNETVNQLQSRITAIENGVGQVHDDTQFIAKEIKNKRLMKKKREFSTIKTTTADPVASNTPATGSNYQNNSDTYITSSNPTAAAASSSESSSSAANNALQQKQPNWAVSLTPNGLRIDTSIISLNDLYDILLSGLSQLRTMATTDKTHTTPSHTDSVTTEPSIIPMSSPISPSVPISKQPTRLSSTTEALKPKHENHHDHLHQGEDEEDSDELNAVVIKHNPLYKSKDIIFPLYSAWESSATNHPHTNHSNMNNNELHTSRPSSICCMGRKLPHPELLGQLLKIYEQCFLCLPLPDMDLFLQQCKQQTTSPLLINAVLSWSARHAAIYHGILGQQDPNKIGEPYFIAAKALLRDEFLTPRVETVHALLLMYIYSIGKTGPDRCESEAYTFLGLATRMSLDLGLHHRMGPYEEKGRRLFAALEFLETLCAAHSDKPMLFPQQAETIQLMEHEQVFGERRYRIEFTMHRHKINQIYRRIHTSCHQSDPLFKTVSNLERELKAWYNQLPWYFQYNQQLQHYQHHHHRSSSSATTKSPWTSSSFREQACLKLNFEYHFQMCQLYSIFLPPHPDKQHTVNLLSLRLCLNSADAITELLECWAQLQQSWCHFTLDTIVMACLVYGYQLKSNKTEVLSHAKRQMQRIAAVLEVSPVRHHKYVRTLIARIEKQTNPSSSSPSTHGNDEGDEELDVPPVTSSSSSSPSPIWHEQLQQQQQHPHPMQPSSSPHPLPAHPPMQPLPAPPLTTMAPPPTMTAAPSASLEEDWSWLKPTDLAVNDLFRFADFIYTPTMDMMGYQWPPI
ncbi:hypothetical protein BDA99DRAFT_538291 [Phascolomyces articulosus]|uniref:Uncharacterized protein n=1 Tax=Phascolomyces articulosus TaxID=60185 RepID=A0AAD5JYU3_9FUNG|nr:hypothetical protein BDA99DRAFT_538291 [Phascolomyces articulosus]